MADVGMFPYGNAHETKVGDSYTFSCQHGSTECVWNMIETCAQSVIPTKLAQFNFIDCIETEDHKSTEYDTITAKCASDAGATAT